MDRELMVQLVKDHYRDFASMFRQLDQKAI